MSNRVWFIIATVLFAVLFVLSLDNGFQMHDLSWAGFACFAGGHIT